MKQTGRRRKHLPLSTVNQCGTCNSASDVLKDPKCRSVHRFRAVCCSDASGQALV
jgi:hypothetical protein